MIIIIYKMTVIISEPCDCNDNNCIFHQYWYLLSCNPPQHIAITTDPRNIKKWDYI